MMIYTNGLNNIKHIFDLSESVKDHKTDYTNQRNFGTFKDETKCLLIVDFISLNPK